MLQHMFYHPSENNSTKYHTHLLLSIFLRFFFPHVSEYLRPDIRSYIYIYTHRSLLFLTHRSAAAGHHELLRHLRGRLTGAVAHVEDAVLEHGFLLAVASPRRCWWSQNTEEKYPTDADFLDELKQDSLFLGDWFRDFSDSRIYWGFGGAFWRKMRKRHQQEWSIHKVSAVFWIFNRSREIRAENDDWNFHPRKRRFTNQNTHPTDVPQNWGSCTHFYSPVSKHDNVNSHLCRQFYDI